VGIGRAPRVSAVWATNPSSARGRLVRSPELEQVAGAAREEFAAALRAFLPARGQCSVNLDLSDCGKPCLALSPENRRSPLHCPQPARIVSRGGSDGVPGQATRICGHSADR